MQTQQGSCYSCPKLSAGTDQNQFICLCNRLYNSMKLSKITRAYMVFVFYKLFSTIVIVIC